mmetsp:Transcript_61538/g.155435  ORF Transcript_61538/g.155435 Transcript_61538/m.155435 type:complete len:98 (+) Transcript_61538:1152-1445(+)
MRELQNQMIEERKRLGVRIRSPGCGFSDQRIPMAFTLSPQAAADRLTYPLARFAGRRSSGHICALGAIVFAIAALNASTVIGRSIERSARGRLDSGR